MLCLDQWKEKIAQNPAALEEFEEYVSWLVAEYLDISDHRRTKLFREIEAAYNAFPLVESISESYIGCLVLLDGVERGKRGEAACKLLADAHRRFPNNPSIAEDYAYLLSMRTDDRDSEQCLGCLRIAEPLSSRFPDNEEIQSHLTQIRDAYSTAQEYERLTACTAQLKQEIAIHPDDPELIAAYVGALTEYADYTDEAGCREIRSIIAGCCDRYGKGRSCKEELARVDVSLIRIAEEDEAEGLLREIEKIFESDPSDTLAAIYADALSEICSHQGENHSSAVKKTARLYDAHPEHPNVQTAYAFSLLTAMELQGEAPAKKTLQKIFALAEKHPQNKEIRDHLEDAKRSFAIDHEDAVFWELPVKEPIFRNCFAVLDTETTWSNRLMSVGVVIADRDTLRPAALRYYVLVPEWQEGGMYSAVLSLSPCEISMICSREEAVRDLTALFQAHQVDSIYGYNVAFDKGKLPELKDYAWFDIMPLAANRRYNEKITPETDCYSSGRMKRGYGVEPMMHILSERCHYREIHNALFDAADELRIMQHLGYSLDAYSQNGAPVKNPVCKDPNECPEEEFAVGDRIYHQTFGHGLIVECQPIPGQAKTLYLIRAAFIRGEARQFILPLPRFIRKV